MIPAEIVLLVQGAQVVDLAGVVEVMLDRHRDDPARLLQFTPVRHPRTKQLGVIQDSDTCSARWLRRSLTSGSRHRSRSLSVLLSR